MSHEKFKYKSLDEIKAKAKELGVELPFAEDTSALTQSIDMKSITLPNRLGTAPMEGADSLEDGSPSDYTARRYMNAAKGGSAIIWFEAVTIVPEGRSSKTQLLLTEENADTYRELIKKIKAVGMEANGFEPYIIMQTTHSGRYSNPGNKPAPMIAYRHPALEEFRAADDSCIITDACLQDLEKKFGEATKLAKEVGFDAVDIKSCHGYLITELMSAYNREGIYGGSFENRTRFFRNCIKEAKVYEDEKFMVTARIGIYDGYAYPYGFGVSETSGIEPDFTEPIKLIKALYEEDGIAMVNLTMGNPYATTHVTRPYDAGKYIPDEHPFIGLNRMIQGIGTIKKAVPEMKIYASAPTYLRGYADLFTAGAVEAGLCDGMLFGRLSFADPDFANEIVKDGRIDSKRICLTCGKCGDLIRAHKPTGCVIRDPETFIPFFREFEEIKKTQPANFRG